MRFQIEERIHIQHLDTKGAEFIVHLYASIVLIRCEEALKYSGPPFTLFLFLSFSFSLSLSLHSNNASGKPCFYIQSLFLFLPQPNVSSNYAVHYSNVLSACYSDFPEKSNGNFKKKWKNSMNNGGLFFLSKSLVLQYKLKSLIV